MIVVQCHPFIDIPTDNRIVNSSLLQQIANNSLDRKVHSGSADSGQSSSPDTSSSTHGDDNSNVDSLEQQVHKPNGSQQVTESRMDDENKTGEQITIKQQQQASQTGADNYDHAKTATPTKNGDNNSKDDGTIEQADVMLTKPLKSALTNSNNNSAEVKSSNLQKFNNNNAPTTNNLSSNFSGLNLNMTASEMKELLARRKKFDPKKAQMNIRQKYEIIQQM